MPQEPRSAGAVTDETWLTTIPKSLLRRRNRDQDDTASSRRWSPSYDVVVGPFPLDIRILAPFDFDVLLARYFIALISRYASLAV